MTPHRGTSAGDAIGQQLRSEGLPEMQRDENAWWRALPGVFFGFELDAQNTPQFRFVSDSALEVYGFTPAQLLRDPSLMYSRVDREDFALVRQLVQTSWEAMRRLPLRWRYDHPVKGQRWLESWSAPVPGVERPHWHGWAQDITETQRDSRGLDQANLPGDAGGEPVYGCSINGEILFANAAGRRLLGPDTPAIGRLSKPIQSLIPADWHGLIHQTLSDGAAFYRGCATPAPGREIEIEAWISHGMLGDRNALWVFLRDVTDRLKAEKRLRMYETLFECSHSGTLITDERFRIIDVNPAYLRMTGFSRQDLIGLDSDQLAPPGRDPLELKAMQARLLRDGYWHDEYERYCKDGQVLPNLLSLTLVRDEAGQITNVLSVSTDISELKAHQHRLERLAHFDGLTGLPNRVCFAERLEAARAESRDSGLLLAVCYLDLDGFKPINDRHGHGVGDALLAAIGARIKALVRPEDTVARIGGDEFAILLTGLPDTQTGLTTLDALLAAVAEPVTVASTRFSIQGSVGVTFFPSDDADADTLLRHADQAMYRAKRRGRGRHAVFDATLERAAAARQRVRSEFAQAIERGELILAFEPKVDLQERRVVGAEALIRWWHPREGLLPPAQFLSDIDDTDLIVLLGEWVATEVRAQLERWEAVGLCLPVSINIAAHHLRKPDFAQRLDALVGAYTRSRPGRIEVEIVESAALGDIDSIARTMRDCRAFGVSFALDDFGTGYSSLALLRHLPADTLKIDRSFVIGILENVDDRTLVSGLIGLARNFGREVIAEGVESEAHIRLLLELGCHRAQGYGFTRPLSADAFVRWVGAFEAHPREMPSQPAAYG